jgi:drug/metabolite transporter (DMT)-like permease
MGRYNPWTVLFYALLIAAVFWNTIHPLWKEIPPSFASLLRPYSTLQWGWILYIAVAGTIVPFGLYFEGINLIRSTRASITATLEPITAGFISYFFLSESLSRLQILGAVFVIASIVLLQLRQEYDDKTPALIRNPLKQ